MVQNASSNHCKVHLMEMKLTKSVTLPKIPSGLMRGNPQFTEEGVISGSTHHLQLLPISDIILLLCRCLTSRLSLSWSCGVSS